MQTQEIQGQSITAIMDSFFAAVNARDANSANSVLELTRLAGRFDPVESIEALARLLVVEHTRRKCLEGRLAAYES